MLFGYPAAATEENWFHDCLIQIIQTIHVCNRERQPVPAWPAIIPEAYRTKLSGKHGLRDRLNTYQAVVEKISPPELEQVINALNEQNDIASLLSGARNCETIDDLPDCIRQPVKELFTFAFKLLTDLEIRDHHYKVIYEQTFHICPFCGCEHFDAPSGPREALDHYLAESKYPFAAANLCNLVPMGHKCNSKYKLAQDILYNDDGTRRKSYYPYDNFGKIKIILVNSEPFAGAKGLFPGWQIDFEPNTEEVSTWDSVFHIRERYGRDILDPDFKSWLREFISWCVSALTAPESDQEVIDAIKRYSKHLETMGMGDRAFLKAAVFRMLLHHCQRGNQRLFGFMKGLVIGGMVLNSN
jgi:hypothetical protein